MKPVDFSDSNVVFTLPGGNESNNLPIYKTITEDGKEVLISVWEPSDEEREAIAAGKNIQLIVWGQGHPPVALALEE